jgi:putative flippase GtrA
VDYVTRQHGFGFRFSLFSMIGGGVFVAGLALQILLVRYAHIGADPSYAAQAVFSIELSYLLNRYLTWRDRSVGWWAAAWKFNAQKLIMTVINLVAYALLVRFGMEYVVANVLLTAIFTPVNYVAGDLLVFARGARRGPLGAAVEPRLPEVLPTVSVVIPCKNSERTIRATVESFLAQDYPALAEVILVGDVGDPTWMPLDDVNDPRMVLIEQEKTPGRRDPNVKRDKGIRKSSGDVIALADSDIVVDPGWVGRAVALLNGQGGGLVAGGMRSINDTFWGRFVDNNVLAAKTPRVARPYQVTAENFGARGYKPPITANAVFTRSLYDECSLDTAWSYGYEDYEWFWRLAKDKHKILFSSELTAAHHHRRSFRHLVREYRQSAHGCAQFIRAHPDSPLARKRTMQAFGLPIGALGALALGALAVADGYGALVFGVLALATVLVAGREVSRTRSLEGLTYPPAALALGGIYAASIAGNLIRPSGSLLQAPAWKPSASAMDSAPEASLAESPSIRRPWWRRISWPLCAVLALQAGVSLSLVWRNTAFGDEALYLWAGHIELEHWLYSAPSPIAAGGGVRFSSYFSGAPQIYPPIGAIADSIGGLAAARILSLVFMLGCTLLLYVTSRRLFSSRVAIVGCAIWITSEPCLKLGAFATFDAMAVFLVCLGVWLAVRAGQSRFHGEMIALAAASLAVGALTAYSYLIYLPFVIVIAGLSWIPYRGCRRAIISSAWLTGATAGFFIAGATVLKLWPGLSFTVLNRRVVIPQGYRLVIMSAWSWQGIVTVVALIGVAVAIAVGKRRLLIAVLAGACLIVPFQQARIQTGVSLDKHLSLGIWLAAMVAGYGIDSLFRFQYPRLLVTVCGGLALAFCAIAGTSAAQWSFAGWNNSSALVAAFNRVSAGARGGIAVGNADDNAMRYYTSHGRNWSQWASKWTGILPATAVGSITAKQRAAEISQYRSNLDSGAYGMVVVFFKQPDIYTLTQTAFTPLPHSVGSSFNQEVVRLLADNRQLNVIVTALLQDPAYKVVAVAPYGRNLSDQASACVIWRRVSVRHAGVAR